MTYRINKTDGSLLTELSPGTIDQISTSLTLIGSDYSGYGEIINENFVQLLESFANTIEPSNPTKGQLWFDSSLSQLKVYDGEGFKVSGGPVIQSSRPLTPSTGDIWINSTENQLSFFDGNDMVLVGPLPDAATKEYVQKKTIPLAFYVATKTGDSLNEYVLDCLNEVAPPTNNSSVEYPEETMARILCTSSDLSTITQLYKIQGGEWILQ